MTDIEQHSKTITADLRDMLLTWEGAFLEGSEQSAEEICYDFGITDSHVIELLEAEIASRKSIATVMRHSVFQQRLDELDAEMETVDPQTAQKSYDTAQEHIWWMPCDRVSYELLMLILRENVRVIVPEIAKREKQTLFDLSRAIAIRLSNKEAFRNTLACRLWPLISEAIYLEFSEWTRMANVHHKKNSLIPFDKLFDGSTLDEIRASTEEYQGVLKQPESVRYLFLMRHFGGIDVENISRFTKIPLDQVKVLQNLRH